MHRRKGRGKQYQSRSAIRKCQATPRGLTSKLTRLAHEQLLEYIKEGTLGSLRTDPQKNNSANSTKKNWRSGSNTPMNFALFPPHWPVTRQSLREPLQINPKHQDEKLDTTKTFKEHAAAITLSNTGKLSLGASEDSSRRTDNASQKWRLSCKVARKGLQRNSTRASEKKLSFYRFLRSAPLSALTNFIPVLVVL